MFFAFIYKLCNIYILEYIDVCRYEMAILDPPYSKDDDTFNMHEWAQSQFSCVSGQSADAFILVYDVSVPLTFKYIQVLREQVALIMKR